MEKNEYRKMFELENDYWWYRALHELVEHQVKSIGKSPLTMIDVGCGTGRMMEILRSYGAVEGVDFSPEAIFSSTKRGNNAQLGDINELKLTPDTYDVILSLDVLCHASITDDIAILGELYRGLSPGGTLILALPAFKLLKRNHDVKVFSKRRYRKKNTMAELQKIGFREIRATYRLPFLFLFILFKKIVERIRVPDATVSDLTPLPRSINALLLFFTRIENTVINAGIPLPFGSSLFIVATK